MENSIFSKAYWRAAASEIKKPRILVLAAILITLRVVLKLVSIPIVPGQLSITFGFFLNALGSMIYGPIVALISGAITDTLGCVIAPAGGPYFFPYCLNEMLGCLLFALVLYKRDLSVPRVMLSRFAVVLGCNVLVQPVIDRWYNVVFFGKNFTLLKLITMLRVFKNLALFPLECLLLVLFLRAAGPLLKTVGIHNKAETLKLKWWHIVLLVLLSLIAFLAFVVWFETASGKTNDVTAAIYAWLKGLIQ